MKNKKVPDRELYLNEKLLGFIPLVWFVETFPDPVVEFVASIDLGCRHCAYAFDAWRAIMITDYEISSKKTFGLTWFDEFYMFMNMHK
jgi:hypothetical protein